MATPSNQGPGRRRGSFNKFSGTTPQGSVKNATGNTRHAKPNATSAGNFWPQDRMGAANKTSEPSPDSSEVVTNQPNVPAANGVYDDGGKPTGDLAPSDAIAKKDESKNDNPKDLENKEEDAANGEGENADASTQDEAQSLENEVGDGFYKNDSEGGATKSKSKSKLKKRLLIGGGIGGAGAALTILGFISLLPLKLVSLTNNLEKHFYSSVDSSVKKRVDKIFSTYIDKKVLPGINGACRSTAGITRSCAVVGPGTSKLNKLFQAWKDNNFEGKLADKYGIEFASKKDGGGVERHFVITKNDSMNLDSWEKQTGSKPDLFTYLKNSGSEKTAGEVRAAVTKALEDETYFKRVIYRFKIGKLLERKYGIKRCIIACNIRDNFSSWKDQKRKAAIFYLVDRVITPRNAKIGIVLECFVAPNGCKGSGGVGADGEKLDEFDQKVSANLKTFAETLGKDVGDEAVQKLVKQASSLTENGVQYALLNVILDTVLSDAAAAEAKDLVPVVGQIALAMQIVEKIDTLPALLTKMKYVTNSLAMVQFYMMYRTHADEIKSGHVDAAMVGSFTNMMGKTGNSGSAESSPLYNSLFDTTPTKTAFDSLFPSAQALAAATPSYKCNKPGIIEGATNVVAGVQPKTDNQNNLLPGNTVCPEDDLDGRSGITNIIEQLKSTPNFKTAQLAEGVWSKDPLSSVPLAPCASLKCVWNDATNWATWAIGKALAPITSQLLGYIQPLIEKFSKFFVSVLIPSPFPDNLNDLSGAKSFTLAGGGADVSGNDTAHYGLGGQKLTDQQVAAIRDDQQQQDKEQFTAKPLYARLFDSSDTNSLISHVALSMPAPNSVVSSLTNLTSNPVNRLLGSFSSLFGSHKVSAAAPSADPFHVTQYGYPLNSADLSTDPEMVNDTTCKDQEKAWSDSATVPDNSTSGVPENTTTVLCKLDDTVIAGLGGIYDSTLLGTDAPGAATDPTTTTPGTAPTTPGVYDTTPYATPPYPTSTAGGIKGTDIGTVPNMDTLPCPTSPTIREIGVVTAYREGKSYQIKLCSVHGVELNALAADQYDKMFTAGEAQGIDFHGSGGFRSMQTQTNMYYPNYPDTSKINNAAAPPGYSNHQFGTAVDITCKDSTGDLYKPWVNGESRGRVPDFQNALKHPCLNWIHLNSVQYRLLLMCDGLGGSGEIKLSQGGCETWHMSPTGG
jgi:hypothetical protein